MIDRYARPAMKHIWSTENKYTLWFEVEALVCEAMAELGEIPKDAAKIIREKGSQAIQEIDILAIQKIESEVKHDVIAFLTWIGQKIGPEGRFLHKGMTSSDLLDTCFALQMSQALDLIIDDHHMLLEVLKKQAVRYKDTPCIGRTHGIHAEPTSFGLKFASFYAESQRNLARLKSAKDEISTCTLSGAVGNYSTIDPHIEAYVAKKLSLQAEPVATQIIPRDRHAYVFSILGIVASAIERVATEIRHLQRSEVREAFEFFDLGQKGSSAMPHKKNPILSENLTGLARIIRSYTIPALENITLWHERDISHSSAERFMAPDATITLDFALHRLTNVVENLIVYPERARDNINSLSGLVHSQKLLLTLIDTGMSREDAYKLVQSVSLKVWETGEDFKKLILSDQDVMSYLSPHQIEAVFDLTPHLKHVETIYNRLFS